MTFAQLFSSMKWVIIHSYFFKKDFIMCNGIPTLIQTPNLKRKLPPKNQKISPTPQKKQRTDSPSRLSPISMDHTFIDTGRTYVQPSVTLSQDKAPDYHDRESNKWIKPFIPNIDFNPALKRVFKDTPIEIFKEMREYEILHEFYSTKSINVSSTVINKGFNAFEQPYFNANVDETTKKVACRQLFIDLAKLWKEGYILIPKFHPSTIVGNKQADNTLQLYTNDWHIREDHFDDIGFIVKSQLNKFLNHQESQPIVDLLIDALNDNQIINNIHDKKMIEQVAHNYGEFYQLNESQINKISDDRYQFYYSPTKTVLDHISDPATFVNQLRNSLSNRNNYIV